MYQGMVVGEHMIIAESGSWYIYSVKGLQFQCKLCVTVVALHQCSIQSTL